MALVHSWYNDRFVAENSISLEENSYKPSLRDSASSAVLYEVTSDSSGHCSPLMDKTYCTNQKRKQSLELSSTAYCYDDEDGLNVHEVSDSEESMTDEVEQVADLCDQLSEWAVEEKVKKISCR